MEGTTKVIGISITSDDFDSLKIIRDLTRDPLSKSILDSIIQNNEP